MDSNWLDLYSDYLISSFSYTTATGLSKMVDGAISHDKTSKELNKKSYGSKEWWQKVKPLLRQIEKENAVLIVDDSIQEKRYTDENDIVAWHYDHSKGRNVKGVNFVSLVYEQGELSLPIGYHLVAKTIPYSDLKTRKERRKSEVTKNEVFRDLIEKAKQNEVQFVYVLADTWFASSGNMMYVKHKIGKDFVMPLKSNRKIALNKENKLTGKYQKLESLTWKENETKEIYLKGVDFPLKLLKQVFKNKDGSEGILHLVSSDLELDSPQITTIYKRRWKVEEYHQSLKGNASLAKSPTKTVRTQANHFFASLWAYVKLEMMKSKKKLSHSAMKAQIYVKSLQAAFQELHLLKSNPLCVT